MGLDMEIRHNGCEVIYMRKENAIRNWVAEHLEGFEDNGLTNFPKEKFEELIDTMYDVITEGGIEDFYNEYVEYCNCEKEDDDDKWNEMWHKWEAFVTDGGERYTTFCEIANENFPSSSGFFFGSTEYDVFYIRQLIVNLQKFKEFYDGLMESDEEWDEGTVEYWEWY